MTKMNPELKKKWVEALRSGEYKQGYNGLHIIGDKPYAGYCCLGVLATVAGIPEIKQEDESYCKFDFGYRTDTTTLPEQFSASIGLTQEHQGVVMNMNDDKRASFDEIADYIEANA